MAHSDTHPQTRFFRHLAPALVAFAMLLLAAEPVRWLVQTWRDPSYDSKGFYVFALAAAIFLWSLNSARGVSSPRDRKAACALLGLTALLRAGGQILAVNVIGALALVIDVYALALLAGLKGRRFAVSPGWLAALFAFSLPLERILQRVGGYALQHLSAEGACAGLQAMLPETICNGVRILIEGHDVLVDLPCSGARIFILLCIAHAALMALTRPPLARALLLGVLAGIAALAANGLRIMLLALGIAFPRHIGGIDVMAQPWHDIIGLACLALAALPLLLLARPAPAPTLLPAAAPVTRPHQPVGMRTASAFALLALVIICLPRKPVDVAAAAQPLHLPAYIAGEFGEPAPLTERESAYFTQYGGSAVKMRYETGSVMLVRTTSPLRHLHAPDECLRGMGFDVRYTGLRHAPVPTAEYIATDTQGNGWRISVTFVAADGTMTTNVSEAVWRWLQKRSSWSAIQRITPLSLPDADARGWDEAVLSSLDIPPTPKTPKLEIAYATPH